jgi:hypothetical protein
VNLDGRIVSKLMCCVVFVEEKRFEGAGGPQLVLCTQQDVPQVPKNIHFPAPN